MIILEIIQYVKYFLENIEYGSLIAEIVLFYSKSTLLNLNKCRKYVCRQPN